MRRGTSWLTGQACFGLLRINIQSPFGSVDCWLNGRAGTLPDGVFVQLLFERTTAAVPVGYSGLLRSVRTITVYYRTCIRQSSTATTPATRARALRAPALVPVTNRACGFGPFCCPPALYPPLLQPGTLVGWVQLDSCLYYTRRTPRYAPLVDLRTHTCSLHLLPVVPSAIANARLYRYARTACLFPPDRLCCGCRTALRRSGHSLILPHITPTGSWLCACS